jgi:hypothetical protein
MQHGRNQDHTVGLPLVANAFQDLLRLYRGRGRLLGTRILYADDMELVATADFSIEK